MKYPNVMYGNISQSEALNPRQVENNAGGFVFAIDDWARLDRFLILGSDAPTYYQKARDLTRDNAAAVERCYTADAGRTVARTVEISVAGRAPKNDPAIFVLAMGAAHPDQRVRQLALAAMPKVCRTATHLFQFVKAAQALGRGWGRSMKKAVARWYSEKSPDDVAYQAVKYREREGFSHRRLLQTAHPAGTDRVPLYRWMRGLEPGGDLPAIVQAHLRVMHPDTSMKDALSLIKEHRLPWEALPTEANKDPAAWMAMLPHLGLTAIIRNLGNMARLDVTKPLSEGERIVVERLSDEVELRKSRVHPFSILQAMAVYGEGQGFRGGNTWTPSQAVMNALDKAFYKAFANVEPTGKRHLIGIDVSHSMTEKIMGSAVQCNVAAGALALVTANTEQRTHIMMFDHGMRPADISPHDRLDTAVKKVSCINGGGTDCSLPMLYATQAGLNVDVFVVLTDNETHSGRVHPAEALKEYRRRSRINAKLIVVGMTATQFSIADPNDPGMLDVVGFDAGAPAVMSEFAR